MAKKRAKSRRAARPSDKSLMTREDFFLNKHDEEKVLLFVTGLVFGMGLIATIFEKFLFGGLAMLVVGLVLLLVELNIEEKMYRI